MKTGARRSRRAVLRLQIEHELEELPDSYQDIPSMMMKWGLHQEPQECIWVVAVGPELDVRTVIEVARGSHVKTRLHIPTLISAVLTAGCERFIMVHNHPSNNAKPSKGDVELTTLVVAAAKATGLYLEDHIILTPGGKWHSLTLGGELTPSDYIQEAFNKA